MPRRSLLWRLVPVALALAGFSIVSHFYGTHPVELLCEIPKAIDDGRSGLDLRVTRPDGKLVVQVEQPSRPPEGRTIVIATRLPRGRYKVAGWLTENHRHVSAEIVYDGEDAIEVPLRPE